MMATRNDRGAIAVLVAVFTSTVLFALAALVVDLGLARDTRRAAQIAADASALAAGNALYPDNTGAPHHLDAVAAAETYAAKNLGVPLADWVSCTDSGRLGYVPTGSTPCVSFNSATKPTQVRVRIPVRDIRTGFARAFGVQHIALSASARASVTPGGALSCALCVLGTSTAHDIGNLQVSVTGGNVHVNGPSLTVGSTGLLRTDQFTTLEGYAIGSSTSYSPAPIAYDGRLTDPLAALTVPPDTSGLAVKTDPCTGGPGIYGARNFTGGSTCTLTPGLYVIAGGPSTSWSLAGNSTVTGTGATLFFTCGTTTSPRPCNSGEAGAYLNAGGGGSLGIAAPTSGPLRGVAVLYSRNNISELDLSGSGSGGFTGTVYARSGTLYFNGGSGGTSYNSAIVVADLRASGSSPLLSISYTVAQNYQPPSSGLHLIE